MDPIAECYTSANSSVDEFLCGVQETVGTDAYMLLPFIFIGISVIAFILLVFVIRGSMSKKDQEA